MSDDILENGGAAATGGRGVPVPSGRLNRGTRLGRLAAGMAGGAAWRGAGALARGERPAMRDLVLTPGNLRRVADELARMRGAAMKMGQLLSMDAGEVMPPELAAILDRLRAEADFMPPQQLRRTLDAQWPRGWQGAFARFDVRPVAAASIGQVHRATLKDGRDVAVKVQYPGVARSIDGDVANVAALVRMSGLLPPGFDLKPYVAEVAAQLHAETDYAAEGRALMRFRDLVADDPRFAVPAMHDDWSTAAVLVMDYVESRPLEDAMADAPQAARDDAAAALIMLLLREVFAWGLVQTDPNLANYRVDSAGRIVLLDFGATRAVDPAAVATYRRMVETGLAGDWAGVREGVAALGLLDERTRPDHAERIMGMARMVFEAVRAAPVYDFADPDLSKRMQAEGIALARSGYVPPPLPVDVLFLQRKFAGLFLIAARLRARVALTDLWRDGIAAVDAARAGGHVCAAASGAHSSTG